MGAGKVWGEDMLLDQPELVDHSQVLSFTGGGCWERSAGELVRKPKDSLLPFSPLSRHFVRGAYAFVGPFTYHHTLQRHMSQAVALTFVEVYTLSRCESQVHAVRSK